MRLQSAFHWYKYGFPALSPDLVFMATLLFHRPSIYYHLCRGRPPTGSSGGHPVASYRTTAGRGDVVSHDLCHRFHRCLLAAADAQNISGNWGGESSVEIRGLDEVINARSKNFLSGGGGGGEFGRCSV